MKHHLSLTVLTFVLALQSKVGLMAQEVDANESLIPFSYERDGEIIESAIPVQLIEGLHKRILRDRMQDKIEASIVFNEDGSITYDDPRIMFDGSMKWIRYDGNKTWMLLEDSRPKAHLAICNLLGFEKSFNERVYYPKELKSDRGDYLWRYQIEREHVAVDNNLNVQASYSGDQVYYGRTRLENSVVAGGSCR